MHVGYMTNSPTDRGGLVPSKSPHGPLSRTLLTSRPSASASAVALGAPSTVTTGDKNVAVGWSVIGVMGRRTGHPLSKCTSRHGTWPRPQPPPISAPPPLGAWLCSLRPESPVAAVRGVAMISRVGDPSGESALARQLYALHAGMLVNPAGSAPPGLSPPTWPAGLIQN